MHPTRIDPPSGRRGRAASAVLRQNESGTVLVVGLALGAVLVASVAELVALGSVVRSREAAQAAADASALENAIWHARGMNAAVALNVVMGITSGVLVLWRLVLAASTLARLVALLALPLGVGAPAASVGTSPLASLLDAGEGVEERLRAMLVGLAAAQTSVAAYTPLLAARGAAELGSAERVETFSASAWAAVADAPSPRLASPISLPLEVEPGALPCAQPVPGWHERVSAAVERASRGSAAPPRSSRGERERAALATLGIDERGDPSAIVVRWAGLADALAPGVFCSPAAPASDGLAQSQRELAAAERRRVERGGAPARDVERALAVLARPSPLGDIDAARVWGPARNGNVYLRSAAQLDSGTLAHSEMYFDCAGSWERCAPDAAWQPRWRARLRRVWPLSELLRAADDTASAWQPQRTLPPAEPELLGGALPPERRVTTGNDPLTRSLEDAASEPRFVH
jgi:hypothetical protein